MYIDDIGSKVNEKLAGVISKLLCKISSHEKVAEKLNSFKRPDNVPELDCTRVNPEIWNSLQSKNQINRHQTTEGGTGCTKRNGACNIALSL